MSTKFSKVSQELLECREKTEEFQVSIEKLRSALQASNSDAAAFKTLHNTMIKMNEEKFQKRIKECQEESDVARKECERKETSSKEMQKELDSLAPLSASHLKKECDQKEEELNIFGELEDRWELHT